MPSYHRRYPVLEKVGVGMQQQGMGYRLLDRVDDLLKARPRLFYGGSGYQRILPGGVTDDQAVDLIAQCLPAETLVLMNPGHFGRVVEVTPGDHLYGVKGEHLDELCRNEVAAFRPAGVLPVYRVRTRGGIVEASFNHPFLTSKRGIVKAWVPAGQLREGRDRVVVLNALPFGKAYRLPVIKKDNNVGQKHIINIPETTGPDMMWLFGFWMGDGYMKPEEVVFASKKDPDIFSTIRSVSGLCFGFKGRYYDGERVRLHSRYIVRLWKELGFTGHADTKRIPGWVYTTPLDQRRAFIQGYLDADGSSVQRREWGTHWHRWDMDRGDKFILTSVNRGLMEDTRKLAMTSGFRATQVRIAESRGAKPRIRGREIRGRGYVYRMGLTDTGTSQVRYERVDKVEYLGEKECYDIQIVRERQMDSYKGRTRVRYAPRHSFIANGFITHNTSWARDAAAGVVNQLGLPADQAETARENWARHLARGLVNSVPSAPPPVVPRGPGRPPSPGTPSSRRRERQRERAVAAAPAPPPSPIEQARAASAAPTGTPAGTTFVRQMLGGRFLRRQRI